MAGNGMYELEMDMAVGGIQEFVALLLFGFRIQNHYE